MSWTTINYLEPSPETKDIVPESIFMNWSCISGYWVLLDSPGQAQVAARGLEAEHGGPPAGGVEESLYVYAYV